MVVLKTTQKIKKGTKVSEKVRVNNITLYEKKTYPNREAPHIHQSSHTKDSAAIPFLVGCISLSTIKIKRKLHIQSLYYSILSNTMKRVRV